MKNVKEKGFTIIEILIVIVIIGILAGIIISVIDTGVQRAKASDAARTGNLRKLIEGITSYQIVEGSFPVDSDVNGSPLDAGDADADRLSTYLQQWPTDSTYYYSEQNGIAFPGTQFACISVPMAKTEDALFYKFVTPNVPSDTNAQLRCGSKIVENCQSSCAPGGGVSPLDLSTCTTLEGEPCIN